MATVTTTTTVERVLRVEEVAARVGVSRVSIWKWATAGAFPAARIIGTGKRRPFSGWLESDVEAWLASRPSVASAPHE